MALSHVLRNKMQDQVQFAKHQLRVACNEGRQRFAVNMWRQRLVDFVRHFSQHVWPFRIARLDGRICGDRSVRGYGGIRPALLLALLTSQNKFAIFFFRGDVGDNQDSSFGSFASQDMKSLKEWVRTEAATKQSVSRMRIKRQTRCRTVSLIFWQQVFS